MFARRVAFLACICTQAVFAGEATQANISTQAAALLSPQRDKVLAAAPLLIQHSGGRYLADPSAKDGFKKVPSFSGTIAATKEGNFLTQRLSSKTEGEIGADAVRSSQMYAGGFWYLSPEASVVSYFMPVSAFSIVSPSNSSVTRYYEVPQVDLLATLGDATVTDPATYGLHSPPIEVFDYLSLRARFYEEKPGKLNTRWCDIADNGAFASSMELATSLKRDGTTSILEFSSAKQRDGLRKGVDFYSTYTVKRIGASDVVTQVVHWGPWEAYAMGKMAPDDKFEKMKILVRTVFDYEYDPKATSPLPIAGTETMVIKQNGVEKIIKKRWWKMDKIETITDGDAASMYENYPLTLKHLRDVTSMPSWKGAYGIPEAPPKK